MEIVVNENVYKLLQFITQIFSIITLDRASFSDEENAFTTGGVSLRRWENGDSFLRNDGSDMFPIEGLGDISFFHTVDDLNLTNDLAILEDLETGALDN